MRTAVRHINIPVFIPHLGCPNMCVFCNQRYISGVDGFVPEQAQEQIEKVLSSVRGSGCECEIAFFGGSFTGIDRTLMIKLLDLAQSYVDSGDAIGVRMSTRPDYIDDEIIEILSRYTVTAVELGIQSFDERVLAASKRGHTGEASRIAMTKLRKAGFRTVGQMMIGLPASTPESERECAREIVRLGADAARIYPTIVFSGTELSEDMKSGKYVPLSVKHAVTRSADVLEIFIHGGVECLRIGLCESENLHSTDTYNAGPNHPSLGELVYSEIYRRRISNALSSGDWGRKDVIIRVPRGDISQAVGQKSANKNFFIEKYGVRSLFFREDDTLNKYEIIVGATDPDGRGEATCT